MILGIYRRADWSLTFDDAFEAFAVLEADARVVGEPAYDPLFRDVLLPLSGDGLVWCPRSAQEVMALACEGDPRLRVLELGYMPEPFDAARN